jgi:hypothetical protein
MRFALPRRAGASSSQWALSPTSASRRRRRESTAPDGHLSEAPSVVFATAHVDARAPSHPAHEARVSRPARDPPDHLGGSAFAEPPYVLRAVLTHQQPHQPGTDPPTKKSTDREETSSDSRPPFAHKDMNSSRPAAPSLPTFLAVAATAEQLGVPVRHVSHLKRRHPLRIDPAEVTARLEQSGVAPGSPTPEGRLASDTSEPQPMRSRA